MEIKFDEAVKHIGHSLRVIRQDGKITLGCNDCCLDLATEEERCISAGKIVLCEKFGCAYIEDAASGAVLTTPMNADGTISVLNADWGEVDFSRISREEGDEIRKFLRPVLFAMKAIGTGVLDEKLTDDFPYTYNSAEDRMYINIDTEVWYSVFHRNGKFYLMRGSAYAMMGDDGEVFVEGRADGFLNLMDAIEYILTGYSE